MLKNFVFRTACAMTLFLYSVALAQTTDVGNRVDGASAAKKAVLTTTRGFFRNFRQHKYVECVQFLVTPAREGFDATVAKNVPQLSEDQQLMVRDVQIRDGHARVRLKVSGQGAPEQIDLELHKESNRWLISGLSAGNGDSMVRVALGGTNLLADSSSGIRSDQTDYDAGELVDGTQNPKQVLADIERLAKSPLPDADKQERVREIQMQRCQDILDRANRLLALEKDPQYTAAAGEYRLLALQTLVHLGNLEAARELVKLPEEFDRLGLNALALRAKTAVLTAKMSSFRPKKVGEILTALETILEHLSQCDVGRAEVKLGQVVAQYAELANEKVAVLAYRNFGDLFVANADPQVNAVGKMMLAKASRFDLIGNPLELKGVTVTGDALDWAKFKGKVVLVNFWATWCGHCRAEVPNIQENYERYNDQGFEVVSVSIDRDIDRLRQYLKRDPTPWINLADNHPRLKNSLTRQYGINSVPVSILIGRDGNVISLRCRGDELDNHLSSLFAKN